MARGPFKCLFGALMWVAQYLEKGKSMLVEREQLVAVNICGSAEAPEGQPGK